MRHILIAFTVVCLIWCALLCGAMLARAPSDSSSESPVLAPVTPDDLPVDSRGWPKYP